jgi:hypothetical protein
MGIASTWRKQGAVTRKPPPKTKKPKNQKKKKKTAARAPEPLLRERRQSREERALGRQLQERKLQLREVVPRTVNFSVRRAAGERPVVQVRIRNLSQQPVGGRKTQKKQTNKKKNKKKTVTN